MMTAAKAQGSNPRVAGPAFMPEDVHCTSAAKSFDYRVRIEPTYAAQPLVTALNERIARVMSLGHMSSA